jgi:hypothetical protein
MKQKPWRLSVGLMIGIVIGIAIWWSAFQPGMGLFQRPQLIVVPTALAALVVILQNKKLRATHSKTKEELQNHGGEL